MPVAPQKSSESLLDFLLRSGEDPEPIARKLGPKPWPWRVVARLAQLEPTNIHWRTWLMLSGRGFGKTRAGAEWSHECAMKYALGYIVGPTANDVRSALIEGESGLLATAPPGFKPEWKSQEGKLTWPNGSVAYTYSAETPDRLRNKQGMWGWCDELAAWQYLQDTWDNMQFGLRLGPWPRALVTTTPRGIDFLRRLVANAKGEEIGPDGDLRPIETVVTGGSTFENAQNLSPSALKAWKDRYEGTRLGRQELEAAILDDAENALWTHARLDALRVRVVPCNLVRVVVAVDPSAGSKKNNDEQGIGVVGLGEDGHIYVLDDRTCKLSPDGWAETAVQAAVDYGADCIVGEINCGGEMVGALVKGAMTRMGVNFRYVLANAKMGKGLRAEPVSALYETGRAHHVGTFAKLEDEMCLLSPFGYQGTKSPNRVDACLAEGTMVETELGSVPIESVRVGDRVLTRQGPKRVLGTKRTRASAAVRTIFTTIGEFTGTTDHSVLVNGLWCRLDAIVRGDRLLACSPKQQPLSQSSTRALSIHECLTLSSEQIASTTAPISRDVDCAAGSPSMLPSGPTRTGESLRRDGWFTMLITTLSTTTRTILSASHAGGMHKNMPKSCQPFGKQNEDARSEQKHLSGPLNGTAAQRDAAGIENTGLRPGQIGSQIMRALAWCAVSVSMLTERLNAALGVVSIVPQRSVFGSRQFALSAIKISSVDERSSRDFVVANVLGWKDEERRVPVYDLMIDGVHEFFANGHLVHNCVWAATELLPGVHAAKSVPKTVNVRGIEIDEDDRKPELSAAQVSLLPDVPAVG